MPEQEFTWNDITAFNGLGILEMIEGLWSQEDADSFLSAYAEHWAQVMPNGSENAVMLRTMLLVRAALEIIASDDGGDDDELQELQDWVKRLAKWFDVSIPTRPIRVRRWV